MTNKQKNYIAFLEKQNEAKGLNFEKREPQTVAEASAYIGYLLKISKQEPKTKKTTKTTTKKTETKKAIDWAEMRRKYNATGKNNEEKAYLGGSCWEGSNRKIYDNKERKRIINNALKELKKYINFDYKLSVKNGGGIYDLIKVKLIIDESAYLPYEKIESGILSAFGRYCWGWNTRTIGSLTGSEEYNIYKLLKQTNPRSDEKIALLKSEYIELYNFVNDLVYSFKYNYSNSMVDYFDFNISVSVDFEQKDTERAEKIDLYLQDLANHWEAKRHEVGETTQEESKLIEKTTTARREKWEKERAEEEARRAKEKAEQEARLALLEKERQQKENKIKALFTDENIEILDIEQEESKIQFAKIILSNFNKIMTFEEVEEEIQNGHAHEANMIFERIINFKSAEALEIFKNNLMRDWVQLLRKENGDRFGGWGYYSRKERKFYNEEGKIYFTDEELKEKDLIAFYAGVLIQLNGKNEFVIDPEGHTYARYAGILANTESEPLTIC